MKDAERALVDVGSWLREQRYTFITPTPETHRRVNARPGRQLARDLRDVFGWSLPFSPKLLPERIVSALRAGDALEPADGALRAGVRFSTLGSLLFAHSAYPTTADNSVFFGPDTYRFARFVAQHAHPCRLVVDVGSGSGAGALSIAHHAQRIILADINPRAVLLSRVNAELAGAASRVDVVLGDLYENVKGDPDLIIANPPYLVDAMHRRYRDGGAALGTALGIRMVAEGLERLAPKGRFMLYTGAPIANGIDRVHEALAEIARAADAELLYEEIDPDVFGEELDTPAYAEVDRIAAVGAVIALRR